MNQLLNTVNDRNQETPPNQFLTIHDISSQIDKTQELLWLESFDKDLISSNHLELDQYQIFDKLTSYHFNKIELEHECNPIPNFVIQF